jgi:hypothetical protein
VWSVGVVCDKLASFLDRLIRSSRWVAPGVRLSAGEVREQRFDSLCSRSKDVSLKAQVSPMIGTLGRRLPTTTHIYHRIIDLRRYS